MNVVSTIVGAIVLGAILGYIGKLLVPGRQNIPPWATIGTGFLAAVLGGFVATWLGVDDTRGVDWWKLLFQLVFAAVGISIVARLMGRGSNTGVGTRSRR